MSLEKLALMGIILFVFIAAVQIYSTTRTIKRSMRRKGPKPRRLVGSDAVAMDIAVGLVREVAQEHPGLIARARTEGRIIPELEAVLEEPMMHYRERVLPRFRSLFYTAVNQEILGKNDTSETNGVSSADGNMPGPERPMNKGSEI